MRFRGRNGLGAILALILIAATAWALSFKSEPPADFTFVNDTEIKSVDPALIIGQPEMRVVMGLFEGLVNWDPKTLAPIPGVAKSWEISDDGLIYTFHFRDDACWTDGSRVMPQDFLWQWRRVLDPLTISEYSYQLYYIENAERYSAGPLNPGDRVEIETFEAAAGALPHARGKVLRGRLAEVLDSGEKERPVYVVEIDGHRQGFQTVKTRDFATWKPPELSDDVSKVQPCKTVLLDFDEVGAKAIDDRTLQVKLRSPTSYFLFLTGYYPLFAINPRCVETYGYPAWTKPENIVTNGAFKLQSRKVRERTRLVKNEKYWNAANVRLNTIDVLPVESQSTALNLYLSGQAEWIPYAPKTIIPTLLADKRPDFNPEPEMTVEFYRINCTKPPLDNPLVRKALALAVDRRQIVEGVTRGGELPAESVVPPGLPGYQSPKGPEFNLELARKLLAEAGYPDGKGLPKIEVLYNTKDENQSIAELIQSQWKQNLGIDVGLVNMEWNAYLAAQQNLQYQISRAGWIGDYLDPNTFLDMWTSGNPNNQTGWSNKRYDELISQAAAQVDPVKRMETLREAEAIFLDELPVVPIYFRVTTNLVRPYVKGWYNNLLDTHPLDPIWIDKDEKQQFLKAGGRG
jgi:oligopeptide transport system substrate-binding protein